MLFGFSGRVSGQCNPSIPSNADQQEGQTLIHGTSGAYIWLCPGSNLSLNNTAGSIDNVTVYAEENSTVNIGDTDGADGNTVYAQDNVSVNIGSNATNTTVNKVSSASVVDQGTGTTTNSCGTMTFDLSNAPPDQCNATSIGGEEKLASELEVYNSRERVRIEVPEELLSSNESLEIGLHDMLGKKVHSRSIQKSRKSFDPELPTGIYHYRVRKDGRAIDSGKLMLR